MCRACIARFHVSDFGCTGSLDTSRRQTLSAGNTSQAVSGTGNAGAGGASTAPTVTTASSITSARIPRIFRVIGIPAGYG